MNVIAWLEYELEYYNSAVHRFNHYTMRTPTSNSSIWLIDGTLLSAATPGQNGSGSNGNEGVFYIPQNWSFTIRWFSIISWTCVGGGVLPFCSWYILQPQQTRLITVRIAYISLNNVETELMALADCQSQSFNDYISQKWTATKHQWLYLCYPNFIYIYIYINGCLWCNGYRHVKWTWWHKFKSWTRLIAFYIALIPLGKVWIQIFSLQL